MITLLDDYAIHQTPEPLSRPATSDRNFYDRWFFSGYAADGRFVFEAALGLYPHRRVMDAHFTVLVDGVQHCFHGSRRAPFERTEMSVGPFVLTIEQPMRVLRLQLDDSLSGLACDLRFTASTAPGEEPRSRLFDEDRLVMDTTRYTQFGTWNGEIRVRDRHVAVHAVSGVRDKSWGIRPCGEPEGGAPSRLQRAPTVYWAWAPLAFDDRVIRFNTFEDTQGRATQLEAVVEPIFSDAARIPDEADVTRTQMHCPKLQVRWKPGTRHPDGGTLTMLDPEGASWRIELQPLATLVTKGLGYHHPDWGHGAWKGELALGQEALRLAELDPLRPDHVHVHQLVRGRLLAPDGEHDGIGLLETMCFGPHAPSGFRGFLDGAPDRGGSGA